MKKMLKLLIALVILYFIIQQVFYLFSSGHETKYTVKVDDKLVNVREVLSSKGEETDGYYIDVNFDDYNIPFKIYKKFSKKRHIVKNIEIFTGDSYTCVKLNIKNKTNETDIKCINKGIVYYYSNLKGLDAKLDNLIASSNYDSSKYISDEFVSAKDNINYYVHHLHYLWFFFAVPFNLGRV